MSLEIYKEYILDLYKHPHNQGVLENATHKSSLRNPFCGDEININLIVEDDKVKDVKFSGIGCAISIASASLITDKIKNMNIENVKSLNKDNVLQELKIPISHVRLKCALLVLDAIKGALENANPNWNIWKKTRTFKGS